MAFENLDIISDSSDEDFLRGSKLQWIQMRQKEIEEEEQANIARASSIGSTLLEAYQTGQKSKTDILLEGFVPGSGIDSGSPSAMYELSQDYINANFLTQPYMRADKRAQLTEEGAGYLRDRFLGEDFEDFPVDERNWIQKLIPGGEGAPAYPEDLPALSKSTIERIQAGQESLRSAHRKYGKFKPEPGALYGPPSPTVAPPPIVVPRTKVGAGVPSGKPINVRGLGVPSVVPQAGYKGYTPPNILGGQPISAVGGSSPLSKAGSVANVAGSLYDVYSSGRDWDKMNREEKLSRGLGTGLGLAALVPGPQQPFVAAGSMLHNLFA